MDRKGKVRQFLSRFLKDYALADDEDIFGLGVVNSLLALQLVQFVEKEFEVEIDDEDLDLDNFRSIVAIDTLVGRKLGEAGTAS